METIGIVAEYNPFHLGHAHQLSYLAERWPEALKIVVMSGSFVQRGMPAYFSKFDRAKWALLGGADIVIELPSVFAVRSAEIFASGAMRLLAGLGLEAFSFGTEHTNLDLLIEIAKTIENPETQERTRELIKSGLSYGSAQRQAVMEFHSGAEEVMSQPNSLLGIEYLRAVQNYNLEITPLPVPRQGDYHAETLQENDRNFPSATALRKELTKAVQSDMSSLFTNLEKLKVLEQYFPEDIGPLISEAMQKGHYLNNERYYDLIQYNSRSKNKEELANLGDFGEGIENRWKKASAEANWLTSRELIKSKRYTYARLDRMATYTVLNWSQAFLAATIETGPTYARLLGFTEAGRNWLRGNESSLPIIQKWAPFVKTATGLTKKMVEADMLTTDLQALCFENKHLRNAGLDFTYTPYYLP